MTDAFSSFSLLFADPTAPREEQFPPRTMDFIGSLPGEEGQILRRILSQKITRRDLDFRKEILEDFLRAPALLAGVENIFRRWELLSETARREKAPAEDLPWEDGLELLKDNALSVLEHLKFLRLAADALKGQPVESKGLFAFGEYLRRKGSSEASRALTEQLSALPLLRAENVQTVLQLNPDRFGAVHSADVAYLGTEDQKFLKKHPVRREDFSARIPKGELPDLTAAAIRRLCGDLQALSAEIRGAFEPLREGLVFYRFALTVTEWGRSKGYGWKFPSPTTQSGPKGRGIRDPWEAVDGLYRAPLTCSARALEAYRGEWGTHALRTLARAQIFAAAGLPAVAEEMEFSPDQRVLVCDFEGKTVEEEIAGLAELYRSTRRGDILLLNRPLMTVGSSPASEVLGNLLRAFHKKGAAVRLATDLSVD